MEEMTRQFMAQSKSGHVLKLIEYSFPIDMSDSNKQGIVDIARYKTEDGRTVEKVNGAYQILGESELYYEHNKG